MIFICPDVFFGTDDKNISLSLRSLRLCGEPIFSLEPSAPRILESFPFMRLYGEKNHSAMTLSIILIAEGLPVMICALDVRADEAPWTKA